MEKNIKKTLWFFMLLILPVALFAQKDVTQFLGIPVDGSKSEMIQKLMDKGYTINPQEKDVLVGEFNGANVNIFIVTNNNKVRRIAVMDADPTTEASIKIRFNNLLRQFQNNKKYVPTPDSIIAKYSIPQDEDISYELLVKKKSYQADFYQKTAAYDSLILKLDTLEQKQASTGGYTDQLLELFPYQMKELYNCFNKKVWLNLSESSGGYYITIFYDNVYNEANGEGL